MRKEFFQKSIENKTTALQQAYKDIRRDEIRILVKVFTDEAAVDGARASDESAKQLESPRANSASPARPPAQDSPRSSAREPEPAPSYAREGRREPATGSHAPHAMSTGETSPPPSHHAEPDRASEAPRSASGEREKPKARSMPIEESSSIKEAYDIFEGPGSRMI